MATYDRRTFLKHSAMLAACAAAGRAFDAEAYAGTAEARRQGPSQAFFAHAGKLEVIAHRGGNGQWPGETMYAMRQAVKFGADVLEMDVYLTKEGVKNGRTVKSELVLMHDKKVNTTTQGDGLVSDIYLDDLRRLNAGYKWSPDGGKSHPFQSETDLTAERPDDLRVPTLREVFEEFPNKRMVVEMKPATLSPARKLCELIRERGMQDKVLVASFSAPFMDEFRGLCPEVATSATISLDDLSVVWSAAELGRSLVRLTSLLGRMDSPSAGSSKPAALQVPYQVFESRLGARLLERVKGHGIKLHAWTVNNLVDMSLMKTLDVDGIITDYPGPLRTLLDQSPRA